MHYSSVTEGKSIIFLQPWKGSALYTYFYNKSRTLHYGTEQEKGITVGEVSTLQFCKRRKIRYIFIIEERSALYFYNRRRVIYNSEQKKDIARGKCGAILLCKRRKMHYSPAIGKEQSIIGL